MNEQDDVVLEPTPDAVTIEEPAPVIEAVPDVAPAYELGLNQGKGPDQHVALSEPVPAPVPEPEPEPVAVAQPEPVAPPTPTLQPRPVATPTRHVVTNGDADPVHLSACVYENKYARKSLTVHHVQRRLAELGYNDAVGDRDGWYGELTALAVKAFQKDKGFDSTGLMDEATFASLFAGDTNVEIVLT